MNDRANTPASTKPISPEPPSPPPSRPRFVRARAWLRSRPGRIIVPLAALLIGMLLGIVVLLLFGLSGEGETVATSTGRGDIIIEADKAFLTNIVVQHLHSAGMPGTVENVNVTLAQGDQFTITGDDAFSVLGIGVTKHFTIVVQPYIRSCYLQVHVVSANLSSIPVTGFAQAFESQINEQVQQKPSGLPSHFTYCTTNVRTQPDGMFVTYSAIPVALAEPDTGMESA